MLQNQVKLTAKSVSTTGEINLPLSKSMSNRLQMLSYYADCIIPDSLISSADDSILLQHLLGIVKRNISEEVTEIHCKNAGTVLRFLLPLLSNAKQSYLLTGSERMLERPIGPLVEVLLSMGADIQYVDQEGFPPLLIHNADFQFDHIAIDVSQSSQFASAMLMLLPTISKRSTIQLLGTLSSLPYLTMTLDLMSFYGIRYTLEDKQIQLVGQYQIPNDELECETDWSAASYWYQLLAIAGQGELLLKGLNLKSLQGDVQLAELFSSLGVESKQEADGVRITSVGQISMYQNIDFASIPDLAPAVICTCAALQIMGKFTGLETLNLKESRRMDVLCEELNKLGYDIRDNGFGEYLLINSCKPQPSVATPQNLILNTYQDHRMAMAFAPLTLLHKGLIVSDPESVNKSYPNYWEELSRFVNIY